MTKNTNEGKVKYSAEEIKARRPLSPHLSIYKIQLSSGLSIFHRLTGVGLYFSLLLFSWWLSGWIMSNFDPLYLEILLSNYSMAIGGMTLFAFSYHILTGFRHLIWDMGYGFSKKASDISGIIIIILSLSSTLSIILWSIYGK